MSEMKLFRGRAEGEMRLSGDGMKEEEMGGLRYIWVQLAGIGRSVFSDPVEEKDGKGQEPGGSAYEREEVEITGGDECIHHGIIVTTLHQQFTTKRGLQKLHEKKRRRKGFFASKRYLRMVSRLM